MGRLRDDEKRRLDQMQTVTLTTGTLASEASILERIHVVARRCEELRRQMWQTGNLGLGWRAQADDLRRLEAESQLLYADLRAVRAGRTPV